MFGREPLNDVVHRAAYWGNRSDFIDQDKPKIDEDSRIFDPTIVLQYIMLTTSKHKYRLFFITVYNFLIKMKQRTKIIFRMIKLGTNTQEWWKVWKSGVAGNNVAHHALPPTTPLRTPGLSGLKSQILKPPFLS